MNVSGEEVDYEGTHLISDLPILMSMYEPGMQATSVQVNGDAEIDD